MKAASSHHAPAHSDLCPALRCLSEEHSILRDKQKELLQLAAPLQQRTSPIPYQEVLIAVRNKVRLFYTLFSLHAQKEERFLFPLLAKYLRSEAGPIAVMEFEHEQLRFHLATFLNHTRSMNDLVPTAQAKGLLYHLIEISAIMKGHFDKEENMLYPLAQRLLSEKEKQMLSEQLLHPFETVLPMEEPPSQ